MSKAKITQDDQQRFAALLGGDLANDPSHVKPIVTVKISGQTAGAIALGANKYVGKMVQNEVAPTDPAWLESDLGDDDDLGFAAEDDCYVLDYARAGRAADDIVNGNVIGYAPDGRYIVAVSGGGVGFIPVLVVWSAGSDGTSSTVATWTYNIYRMADTGHATALTAAAVQPENSPARIFKGPVTKAADDTTGEAYIAVDGTWKLYSCCEKHGSAAKDCP
jgi:hypothetical protein